MTRVIVILFLFVAISFATLCRCTESENVDEPGTRYISDCEPRCMPAICSFKPACPGYEPVAWIKCATEIPFPLEACPECIVMAEVAPDECEGCEIICESPVCGWHCPMEKPSVGPPCTQICQKPICEFEDRVELRRSVPGIPKLEL